MDFYSDHLNQVAVEAEKLSEEFKTTYIGSEHLILAMLRVPECTASRLLAKAGVDGRKYTEQFRRVISHGGEWVGLTPRTKSIFSLAREYAFQEKNSPITGTEHLLLAVLTFDDCLACLILKGMGVNFKQLISLTESFIGSEEGETAARPSILETPPQPEEDFYAEVDPKLLEYGTDLTRKAREGKSDPVIGRQKEVEKVIQILSRRTKNNPVLVGEPGVGKSAVVEGLAQEIVSGNVPELLRGKAVFSLNLTGLLAGTRYRGDFEERLKKVIDAVTGNHDIILFIDEIHMIVGAGASSESSMDAANILKPMLARGELQTIGATTLDEYRKYIEKDPALERRFTPVTVGEPSVEDTVSILQGLRDKYEAHHNVGITDEAIEVAARLSDRYITDRFLPDKAIDLIDEAASKARLNAGHAPAELRQAEERLTRLTADRDKARKWDEYERAGRLTMEIEKLAREIDRMREAYRLKKSAAHVSIGADDIAAVVSEWTGVPVSRLTEAESARLLHLEEELHRRIVGQDEAVAAVARAVRRARAGLKDPGRPIGSFIFVGPTGVGKTDLSKALAESLFGDERLMVRIDMSEYMEKGSVTKLIGAPPGYVGYGDGEGVLTGKVRKNPYSVVLFDEIEKAHPDVFNLLLQILDDGRLTDSRGRVVSFKNTVLILTSNVGAHVVRESSLGFGAKGESDAFEEMKQNIEEALKKQFRPEFLNRLDDTIVFHKLTKEDTAGICDKLLAALSKRVAEQGIRIRVTPGARALLVEKGFSEEFGARPLKRVITRLVEDRLSEEVLAGRVKSGSLVRIDEKDGKLVFYQE